MHRRPQRKKTFPANAQSVLLENQDADNAGIPRYDDQEEIDEAVMGGELVAIDGVAVSRTLPVERRYARPTAVRFAQELSREFDGNFNHSLQIDSAVRPADCQRRLRRHNENAANFDGPAASTHERGTTIDFNRRLSKREWHWLRFRLMYYVACGKIRVIEERNCIHVFVEENNVHWINVGKPI
jgi:hypothetical protein